MFKPYMWPLLMGRGICRLTLAVVLAGLLAWSATAEVTQTERIAAAGKLWATVKYFHPWLAYRPIDWDGAWIKAYPKLKAAKNTKEFSQAVRIMLDTLGDPVTTITVKPISEPNGTAPVTAKWAENSVLIVTAGNSMNFPGMTEQLRQISSDLPKAHAVIFDLRAVTTEDFSWAFEYSDLQGGFAEKPVAAPAERWRMHSGLATLGGDPLYYSAFEVRDGRWFEPKSGAKRLPVVFVVSERSTLPLFALALQAAGNGRIVSEGAFCRSSLLRTTKVPLPDDMEATLRLSELLYPDGTTGLTVDKTVSPGMGLSAARALINSNAPSPPLAARTRIPAVTAPLPDAEYREPSYPAPAYRTLAALRIWSVYHFFYSDKLSG